MAVNVGARQKESHEQDDAPIGDKMTIIMMLLMMMTMTMINDDDFDLEMRGSARGAFGVEHCISGGW